MRKYLYPFVGLLLISLVGVSVVLNYHDQKEELQLSGPSPYIKYVDDSEVDHLVSNLAIHDLKTNYLSLQLFIMTQHKFLNANQIMKILVVFRDDNVPETNLVRNNALQIMKPYIGPLSTAEATQILQIIPYADGLGSRIIVSQIYDLYNNFDNQRSLNYTLNTYENVLFRYASQQQFSKVFWNNHLVTTEGLNVGFIVDQSDSMATVAYTKEDGTNVTRYQLLTQFYSDTRHDIYQSFASFNYILMGEYQQYQCKSCPMGSYEQIKAFNSMVLNLRQPSGESDLYEHLKEWLSNPYNEITDINIWSDGILKSNTHTARQFVVLINDLNQHRRTKVRINTVSFLVGGDEPQSVRDNATGILEGLANATGGTFIQITI